MRPMSSGIKIPAVAIRVSGSDESYILHYIHPTLVSPSQSATNIISTQPNPTPTLFPIYYLYSPLIPNSKLYFLPYFSPPSANSSFNTSFNNSSYSSGTTTGEYGSIDGKGAGASSSSSASGTNAALLLLSNSTQLHSHGSGGSGGTLFSSSSGHRSDAGQGLATGGSSTAVTYKVLRCRSTFMSADLEHSFAKTGNIFS